MSEETKNALAEPLVQPVQLLEATTGHVSGDSKQQGVEALKSGSVYRTSIIMLTFISFVDAIEYGIVMPSLFLYLKEVTGKKSHAMYGVTIATFSLVSMCTKPIVGSWCDQRSFREVYIVTILLAILGNVLYAMAGFAGTVYLILIGRALSGFGAANTSLIYAYVSRTVPKEDRSGVMFYVGMTFPFGLICGPATNLITSQLDFTLGAFHVRDTNAPGLLLALVLSALLLAIMVLVKEPPPYDFVDQKGGKTDTDASPSVWSEVLRPQVSMCFIAIFCFNFFITASEAIVVPVTQEVFGFSPLQNSFVYCGISVIFLVLTIFNIAVLKRFLSDRYFVLLASLIYGGGVGLVLLIWDYDMPLWKFLLGEVALISGLPFAFSPNRTLFSKEVESSKQQALLSSMLSIAASVGSTLGPLFMGATAGSRSHGGRVAANMFLGLLGLDALLLISIGITWFGCYPPSDVAATVLERLLTAARLKFDAFDEEKSGRIEQHEADSLVEWMLQTEAHGIDVKRRAAHAKRMREELEEQLDTNEKEIDGNDRRVSLDEFSTYLKKFFPHQCHLQNDRLRRDDAIRADHAAGDDHRLTPAETEEKGEGIVLILAAARTRFIALDTDGTGKIDADEALSLIHYLFLFKTKLVTPKTAASLAKQFQQREMKKIDRNHNGAIYFEEFAALFNALVRDRDNNGLRGDVLWRGS